MSRYGDDVFEMPRRRPIDDQAVEEVLAWVPAGDDLTGLCAFVDDVRAVATGPMPVPSLALEDVLTRGFSTDTGDLPATAACNANGSALQTAGLPKWRRALMKTSKFLAGLSMAAKVALGAGFAVAATATAGAAGGTGDGQVSDGPAAGTPTDPGAGTPGTPGTPDTPASDTGTPAPPPATEAPAAPPVTPPGPTDEPKVPQTLAIECVVVADHHVSCSWTGADPATFGKYLLLRTSSDGKPGRVLVQSGDLTTTSWNDSLDITPGVTYGYMVLVQGPDGTSVTHSPYVYVTP